MAITGVSNLTELVSSQPAAPDTPTSAPAPQTQTTAAVTLSEDSFTPSTQNNLSQTPAQDAGLFQVSQSALAAATINILTAQAPVAAQTVAPAQTAPSIAVNLPIQPAAVTTAPITTSVQIPLAAPAPAVAPAPQAKTTAASAANSQVELQSLNTALVALGLDNSNVQDIDRIASSTKAYNPTLYASLVQQYQAQQAAQDSPLSLAENKSATPTKVATT